MKLINIVLLMMLVAVAYCQLANVGASGQVGKREAGFDKNHFNGEKDFNGNHRVVRQLLGTQAGGQVGKREAGFDKENHFNGEKDFNGEHRQTRQVNAGVGTHVGKRSVDKMHFTGKKEVSRAARQVGLNANVRAG
ncbi:hypothetical protein M3Y98_01015100 [Aphelenchoides besseyi]|nr:hypothetical protein M3Y98_01015100 [Aphelenchoides besseyi]KAI6210126.1 hypothetical protein M3Y96_00294500 [Aphelenchoides besseyi]